MFQELTLVAGGSFWWLGLEHKHEGPGRSLLGIPSGKGSQWEFLGRGVTRSDLCF